MESTRIIPFFTYILNPKRAKAICIPSINAWALDLKDFLVTFSIYRSSIYGTHVAPLGLREIGLPMFYKHAAPLGLWVGQDAQPTSVGIDFIAPHITGDLG